MRSVTEFVGRQVDVVAFYGTQEQGEILLDQTLFIVGESGRLTTGIVRLGQRFLIELLTERGSMKYRPERGSTFMLEVRRGQIRTQIDLFAAFSRGLIDVARNLRAYETDTDALDEKFGGSKITGVEFRPGEAKVHVEVRSQDPNVIAILPINVSLR